MPLFMGQRAGAGRLRHHTAPCRILDLIVIATRASRTPCRSENTDLSTIEAKVKQSEKLEVGLRMVAFKARHEALAVLMPEQREKGKAAHEKGRTR